MTEPGKCSVCGVKTKGRHALMCRPCRTKTSRENMPNVGVRQREWQLKKKYGMEPGEFDAWWNVFKGKCGICDNDLTMPTKSRGQSLGTVCVDHDHATGQVRGLLCNACNKALGLFKDDPKILSNAMKWISK